MNTDVMGQPAHGTANDNDRNERSTGKIVAFAAAGLLLIGALWWLLSGSEPQQVEKTLLPGESLTAIVGQENAINVAEAYGLPIQARLIGTNEFASLSPADARKLSETSTDVVLVTVRVYPGDKLGMIVDDEGTIDPESITFTPAPRP